MLASYLVLIPDWRWWILRIARLSLCVFINIERRFIKCIVGLIGNHAMNTGGLYPAVQMNIGLIS